MVVRMQSRGHHIATIVMWLICVIHGKSWTRLPNPAESPRFKNQSLLVCTGEKFMLLKVLQSVPKRISCGESVVGQIAYIPKTDILYLECKFSLKWNGVIWYTKASSDFCSNKYLSCPLLKGKKYTFTTTSNMSPACVLPKGHYKVTVSCTDQKDQEVGCLVWSFTWA